MLRNMHLFFVYITDYYYLCNMEKLILFSTITEKNGGRYMLLSNGTTVDTGMYLNASLAPSGEFNMIKPVLNKYTTSKNPLLVIVKSLNTVDKCNDKFKAVDTYTNAHYREFLTEAQLSGCAEGTRAGTFDGMNREEYAEVLKKYQNFVKKVSG